MPRTPWKQPYNALKQLAPGPSGAETFITTSILYVDYPYRDDETEDQVQIFTRTFDKALDPSKVEDDRVIIDQHRLILTADEAFRFSHDVFHAGSIAKGWVPRDGHTFFAKPPPKRLARR